MNTKLPLHTLRVCTRTHNHVNMCGLTTRFVLSLMILKCKFIEMTSIVHTGLDMAAERERERRKERWPLRLMLNHLNFVQTCIN